MGVLNLFGRLPMGVGMSRIQPRGLRAFGALTLALALMASVLPGDPGMSAAAAGRTLYVATTGRDFNPDGWSTPPNSVNQPWRTMYMTIRRARPGDTIVVAEGTYVEAAGWGAVPGTAEAPIVLKAAPGARVVLQGTLQLEKADFWTVDGINVTYNPARGRTEFLVKFDGGYGWSFRNGEVWGTRGVSNIMVSASEKNGQPKHYTIAGNCIHDQLAVGDPLMNDHHIYLMPGYTSGPGLIERNIFYNVANGASIKAAGPSSVTGAGNVTIRYNTMTHSAAGVIIGYGTNNVTMWRNLIGPQRGGNYSYNAGTLGNHVSGAKNRAVYTGVYGFPKSLRSTVDSTRPITGSYTTWVNPLFDNQTCSGFRPQNPAAANFGRYAGMPS